MARIIYTTIILLAALVYCAKAQDADVQSDIVYMGSTEVVATNSVTLKPGFHAMAGSNVWVHIVGANTYPESNYALPNVNEVNEFDATGNTGHNYVHTLAMLEGTTDTLLLGSTKRIETINYFDGLGRPLQSVTVQGSANRNDIVQPFVYDAFGREHLKYLSYVSGNNEGEFVTNATSQCANYYNTDKAWRDRDEFPYDSIHFEASPLNRMLGATGTGSLWQNTQTVISYGANTSAVEGWSANSTSLTGGFTHLANYYASNQLYITEYTDPDNNISREYKDKLGRVVRKETDVTIDGQLHTLRTAYIYDDFGQLRCVVPPMATATTQTGLCYYYLYDARRRMVEKQLPGAGPVYMVYDKRDRLVMTKDAVNPWMTTIYDQLNRPVITGIVTATNRATVQGYFDSIVGYAEQSDSGVNLGYNASNALPAAYSLSESNIQTVTYYDKYDFLQAPDFNNEASDYAYSGAYLSNDPTNPTQKLTGLVTGTLTRVIDNAVTDNLLLSVSYYDDYGRAIRTVSDNHKGGKDVVYTSFDFVGNPTESVTTHNIDGTGEDVKLSSTYLYDHQGRLLSEKLKKDNDAEITLTANAYGELGELQSKYLHGTGASEKYNQKIDYKYNIKGWLANINEVNSLDKNLFALKLSYKLTNGYGYYNGNIYHMDWVNSGEIPQHYAFNYDELNRLRAAGYTSGGSNIDYYMGYYEYDKNGNISSLLRYTEGHNTMDLLDYTYINGTNKLESVTDGAPVNFKDLGYKAGTNNYSYDLNGNMTEDHNGVDITYNFLNLPDEIVNVSASNSLKYAYTATGVKLQKDVSSSTTSDKVVDYIGPFLYEDSELKVIFTSAGRIVKNVNDGTVLWKYEYNLTDHLGNVRAVFAAHDNGIPELMQQTNYYPFGMPFQQNESFGLEEVANRYLYNGKELQDDDIGVKLDWYDYGARFYDPQLGRWHSIDPLAESYYSQSVYHFSGNNPILYLDDNGMNYNPIYGLDGSFLGTDDQGLQGDAIVMNEKDFEQGMSHEDATSKGISAAALDVLPFVSTMFKSTTDKIESHSSGLSSRPDWDGFVNIGEGVQWAKDNPGALNNPTPDNTLYLDASKLDFGNISSSSFQNLNETTPINLLNKGNVASSTVNWRLASSVYALGRVHMQLHNRATRTVSIINDEATDYDWNPGGTKARDTLIKGERWRTKLNDSHGFKTFYYGFGKLRK